MGGVIHPDVKQSYSYHPEVDYFPIAACPEFKSSYTTAIWQKKKKNQLLKNETVVFMINILLLTTIMKKKLFRVML